LRLAVVSPFVDRRHGTERALVEILERLTREYPCEVHLFAQQVADLHVRFPDERNPDESNSDESHAAATSRVTWHPVASSSGPHILQFIAWFFRNRRARQEFVRRSGLPFDVVLSPGINCSDADVIIVHALFHRLRELSENSSVNSPARAGTLRNLHRKIYYRLLTWLETRIYRNPRTLLAAVSPRTKADLARYFNRQDVSVVPNAVDTAVFSVDARMARRAEMRRHYNFADDDLVLLLIGNDWAIKGLPTLLQAMALLPQLPMRLLVAGADTVNPFRKLAATLQLADRCRWEPSSPDVLRFYSAADVYVSPSLEDSFGMPVAEAMACGLPAITSTLAGISAFVDSNVNAYVLPDPQDAPALAALLNTIYANIALRQQVGSAAARKAREWTWDNVAAQVWHLLNAAMARKSAR
jgi:glycosyltransferase involved in cell wall biosynthesis